LPVKLAEIGNQRPFSLSWALVLFVVLVIVFEFLLRGTVWGLTVRATGSDREVAKCTEVDPDRVNVQTFVLLGVLSAVTGILITLRVNGGNVSAGLGMEFRAIVACAIGGVSLFGYTGSIVGAALGVLLTQVIANGLIAIGMPSEFQDVALGLLLVGVIALDVVKSNIKLPIQEKE
jgi:ribose transport system permease protein